MATKKNSVHGILLLDKAYGVSSNKALMQVKNLFRANKAGHAGCLDPLATGLLPICFGEATKFCKYLLDAPKSYEVELKLGVVTTTDDLEGEVLSNSEVNVTQSQVIETLYSFLGESMQVPSQYSAIKHNGKPLYLYARAGIEIEIQARKIFVEKIEVIGFDEINHQLKFIVSVSKGTYIRSLVRDIGAILGCGAVMTNLRRLSHSQFVASQMVTIEALREMEPHELPLVLLPSETPISHWPSHTVDELAKDALFLGRVIKAPPTVEEGNNQIRLYFGDTFIGLGEAKADGWLYPRRMCPGFMVQ